MLDKAETVLLTGAGFSACAGIPTQASVLPSIIDFHPDFSATDQQKFEESQQRVNRFLNCVFLRGGQSSAIHPDDKPRLRTLTLEDVYTVVDKAIARKDWFPDHPWESLIGVRESLDRCVFTYLAHCQSAKLDAYLRLARRMTSMHRLNWATVTLNWDTVWDQALMVALKEFADKVPDYGHGPLWLDKGPDEWGVQEISADQLGNPLLKLHGSFNWMTCPRCRSIFVRRLDCRRLQTRVCPQCSPAGPVQRGPMLKPLFLTPTILKEFNNPTLNTIWDKAIHLVEHAASVIFVGYSFPLADHDLRYLLRKAIPPGAEEKITVVLSERDQAEQIPAQMQCLLPPARYKGFFGLSDKQFYFKGWESFFQERLG